MQGINEEQQPACNGDQAQNWFGNSSGTLDALFHPPKSSGVHAAVNNNPNILGMDQPLDFRSLVNINIGFLVSQGLLLITAHFKSHAVE